MGNLIRMDLYRMRKGKAFIICLVLAFILALISMPLLKLLSSLATMLATDAEVTPFATDANLSSILSDPFPGMNAMLTLISVCAFFYADVENGYIKNIAGQMPKKGFTILSKFICALPHNLLFAVVSIAGSVAGTILVQRLHMDGAVLESIGAFCLKMLLIQSICAILVLLVSALKLKSLGMVIAVVMGLPLLSLIYALIDSGIQQLFTNAGPIFAKYMPDQLMRVQYPNMLESILVAAGVTCIFLLLAIRIFDKKDVT